MFVKSDFSGWDIDEPLATMQSDALADVETDLSFFSDMQSEGFQLLQSYVSRAQSRAETLSQVYTFETLPDAWPLKLVAHITHGLPPNWGERLGHVKIGLVAINDVNALAWPTVGNVGIMNGLATYFLTACYAAAPYATVSAGSLRPAAKEIAEQITRAASDSLFASSDRERFTAMARCYHYRSKLATDIPENRRTIESLAALYANSAILFIIMHELAHVIQNHDPKQGAASRTQESEADRLATETSIAMGSDYTHWFIAGALSMSLLELHDRLGGCKAKQGVRAHPDDSHPTPYERRGLILEHGIHVLENENGLLAQCHPSLAIAHSMHIQLSALLCVNGLDPLLPFLSPAAAAGFGVDGLPSSAQNVPRLVRAIEDSASLGMKLG